MSGVSIFVAVPPGIATHLPLIRVHYITLSCAVWLHSVSSLCFVPATLFMWARSDSCPFAVPSLWKVLKFGSPFGLLWITSVNTLHLYWTYSPFSRNTPPNPDASDLLFPFFPPKFLRAAVSLLPLTLSSTGPFPYQPVSGGGRLFSFAADSLSRPCFLCERLLH